MERERADFGYRAGANCQGGFAATGAREPARGATAAARRASRKTVKGMLIGSVERS